MCYGERGDGVGEKNSIMGENKNIYSQNFIRNFFIIFQIKIGQGMIVIKSSIRYGGTEIKSQHIPP